MTVLIRRTFLYLRHPITPHARGFNFLKKYSAHQLVSIRKISNKYTELTHTPWPGINLCNLLVEKKLFSITVMGFLTVGH